MRKTSKLVLLLAPLAFGLYGCEYEKLSDMTVESVKPTVIAPVIHDELGVDLLLNRKDEEVNIMFDKDGLAYVDYSKAWNVPFGPKDSTQTQPVGEDVVWNAPKDVELTMLPRFYDSEVYIEESVEIKTCLAQVALRFDKGNSYVKTDKTDLKDAKISGEILIGDYPTPFHFEQPYVECFTGGALKDRPKYIGHAGAKALDGVAIDISRGVKIKLQKLKFTGVKNMVAGTTLHVRAILKFNEVVLKSARGKYLELTKIDSHVLKGLQKNYELEVSSFKNSTSADIWFPRTVIYAYVNNTTAAQLAFKVDGMKSVFVVSSTEQELNSKPVEKAVAIKTTGTSGSILHVGDTKFNDVKEGQNMFELNYDNSNLADAVNIGVQKLTVLGSTVQVKSVPPPTETTSLPTSFDFRMGFRMPFYGWIKHNSVRAAMSVDFDAFPGDALKYLDATADNAVTIRFVFSNGLPINMYALMKFMDAEEKVEILDINLVVQDKQSTSLNERRIFVESAQVDGQGFVTSPVLTEVVAKLSYEQYKNVSEKAKKLVVYYDMSTPGANDANGSFVALRKDDKLKLTVAVEAKANIDTASKLGNKK